MKILKIFIFTLGVILAEALVLCMFVFLTFSIVAPADNSEIVHNLLIGVGATFFYLAGGKIIFELIPVNLGFYLLRLFSAQYALQKQLVICRLVVSFIGFALLFGAAIETDGYFEPFSVMAFFWYPSILVSYIVFKKLYFRGIEWAS